jgi:MFS family permease
MTNDRPDSIWSRTFALLCLAEFLGYAQHFILQPTFPLYITHLGGSPFVVGIVIAAFGVTSVLFRPLIGYWVDRWSETGVMILGLLTQALSISLCFLPFVSATIVSNGLRGIGWAGMNTGGYSLLASSAPVARRGEASGYYGGVQSSATILFPAVALWIIDAPFGGFHVAFVVAMTLALIGAGAGACSIARNRFRSSESSRRFFGIVVAWVLQRVRSQCRASGGAVVCPACVPSLFHQLRGSVCPRSRYRPLWLVLRCNRRH